LTLQAALRLFMATLVLPGACFNRLNAKRFSQATFSPT
jgi:hypothetical protein